MCVADARPGIHRRRWLSCWTEISHPLFVMISGSSRQSVRNRSLSGLPAALIAKHIDLFVLRQQHAKATFRLVALVLRLVCSPHV